MTVTSSNFAAYGGWNSRQRLYSPEARWNTSGDYADNILEMTGRPRTPTDGVGELHSLLALVRRLQISQRRDQAEQQITRLEGMKGQPIGWDGRQAAAPDEATIELASALLRRFAEAGLPIPTATMSPSGNAALFAHDRGLYADIELHADKSVSWLIQLPAGPELEASEPFDGHANSLRLIDILRHAPGVIT